MELKKQLAHQIVVELYSKGEADKSCDDWTKKHQSKQLDQSNLQELAIPKSLVGTATVADMVKLSGESASETKRSIIAGSVDYNGQTVNDRNQIVEPGTILQIGSKKFYRIVEEK